MYSQKEVQSLTNQNTAIERYETKQLNTFTLDEIVNKRYRHDGFSQIWQHTNVEIFAKCDKTLRYMKVNVNCSHSHSTYMQYVTLCFEKLIPCLTERLHRPHYKLSCASWSLSVCICYKMTRFDCMRTLCKHRNNSLICYPFDSIDNNVHTTHYTLHYTLYCFFCKKLIDRNLIL